MEALGVYAGTPPPTWGCGAAVAGSELCKPSACRVVEDKENVLPAGTPLGGPQLLLYAASGKKQERPARRPLSDVTAHYEALSCSKGMCIGAMGSAFGLPMPLASTCGQEAAAAAALQAQAAAVAAAEAAKARQTAVRRQALRTMR